MDENLARRWAVLVSPEGQQVVVALDGNPDSLPQIIGTVDSPELAASVAEEHNRLYGFTMPEMTAGQMASHVHQALKALRISDQLLVQPGDETVRVRMQGQAWTIGVRLDDPQAEHSRSSDAYRLRRIRRLAREMTGSTVGRRRLDGILLEKLCGGEPVRLGGEDVPS